MGLNIDENVILLQKKLQIGIKMLQKMNGISTTKAGKGLNQLIPIKSIFRLGLIRIPGFFEIDTVSHDGWNAFRRAYLYSY